MRKNFSIGKTVVDAFFLKHQVLSSVIAIGFILCSLYANSLAVFRTLKDFQNIERRVGIIALWYCTDGSYNTAKLQIEGDTTIYFKNRVGGWFNNLQYSGNKGEEVEFYTIGRPSVLSREVHYFGLSKEGNPRLKFWIFFDILFYNYGFVLFSWAMSFFGMLLFGTKYPQKRAIVILSWIVSFCTLILWLLALTS